MADTTTTNYAFVQPEVGASQDSWGTKLNQNWADLDSDLKAVSDVANAAIEDSAGTVSTSNIADLAVTTAKIAADAVDGSADDV